ncbi:unnamed protein product [Protopolystoma xenopodis]|uniref:Uncharacterized protein n=1 Tax=Protopolystoma xenopodis TaxID=117903 RepID=A0A3S4ZS09_9PLAT|nr:unnamed protein product [Protopolystoma xenopodis]
MVSQILWWRLWPSPLHQGRLDNSAISMPPKEATTKLADTPFRPLISRPAYLASSLFHNHRIHLTSLGRT